MVGERMIEVPYGDFVDGQKAMADLDALRAIVSHSKYPDVEVIRAVLGIWKDEEDRQA
jgi:hypothetical protein